MLLEGRDVGLRLDVPHPDLVLRRARPWGEEKGGMLNELIGVWVELNQ